MKLISYFICLLFAMQNISKADQHTFILTFGKGIECTGYNICSIDISASNTESENQAVVSVQLKETHVEFAFLKQSVSTKSFLKYFSTGYFMLDEDYVLPHQVQAQLNNKIKILKAGKYKINETSNTYNIEF